MCLCSLQRARGSLCCDFSQSESPGTWGHLGTALTGQAGLDPHTCPSQALPGGVGIPDPPLHPPLSQPCCGTPSAATPGCCPVPSTCHSELHSASGLSCPASPRWCQVGYLLPPSAAPSASSLLAQRETEIREGCIRGRALRERATRPLSFHSIKPAAHYPAQFHRADRVCTCLGQPLLLLLLCPPAI